MYDLLCGDFLYFGFYNTQIMKDAWYGQIKKEEFTLSKEILIYFRLPIICWYTIMIISEK